MNILGLNEVLRFTLTAFSNRNNLDPNERIIEQIIVDINQTIADKYSSRDKSNNYKTMLAKNNQKRLKNCHYGEFESDKFSVNELFSLLQENDELTTFKTSKAKEQISHLEELCRKNYLEVDEGSFETLSMFYEVNKKSVDKLMIIKYLSELKDDSGKLTFPRLNFEYNDGINIVYSNNMENLISNYLNCLSSQLFGQCGYQSFGKETVNPTSSLVILNKITDIDILKAQKFASNKNTIHFIFNPIVDGENLESIEFYTDFLKGIQEKGSSAYFFTNHDLFTTISNFDLHYS